MSEGMNFIIGKYQVFFGRSLRFGWEPHGETIFGRIIVGDLWLGCVVIRKWVDNPPPIRRKRRSPATPHDDTPTNESASQEDVQR